MARKKFPEDETEEIQESPENKKKLTLEVDIPENENLITCEVCGHKNSKNSGMCAMCSNYLFD